MDDLKTVYKASTEKLALENLEEMKKKWPHYKFALKSWETKWPELSTFYQFPAEVRKVIYTTNAIEGLHRQFRKVTKTTSVFPHNESLMKLLWLAQKDITKKWTMSIDNWGMIIGQLSLMHADRIEL
jgi:transposase-like protein